MPTSNPVVIQAIARSDRSLDAILSPYNSIPFNSYGVPAQSNCFKRLNFRTLKAVSPKTSSQGILAGRIVIFRHVSETTNLAFRAQEVLIAAVHGRRAVFCVRRPPGANHR